MNYNNNNNRAGSFSRRRSSVRPPWPSPSANTFPYHDPGVINNPSSLNFNSSGAAYMAQSDWLNAMRTQTHFDFYVACVVIWQLVEWMKVLLWGATDVALPSQVRLLLVLGVIYGVWATFWFWWRRVGEIRGGYGLYT